MTNSEFFMGYIDSGENSASLQGLREFATQQCALPEPILLLGQSGIGKTYLLRAIHKRIEDTILGARVLYQMGVDTVDSMISQIYKEQRPEALPCYQGLDAFLVDDLSCLRGKESTQQEILMLFDFLRKQNVLVLCTSLSGTIEQEYFASRFQGAILDLAPFSDASMRRMIRRKAAEYGLDLTEGQIRRIMIKAAGNGSLIEGAVKRYAFQVSAVCQ